MTIPVGIEKASARAAVNTSPEPFSNIAVSFAEVGLVIFMLWLATNYPLTFSIVLGMVLVLMIWLIVKFVRFLKVLKGIFTKVESYV